MAKPFLKWVGGKRQLMPQILSHLPIPAEALPQWGGTFYEPFMGGGAVFFALEEKGLQRAVLNDYNPELVNVYRVVQTNPTGLAKRLLDVEFANTVEAHANIRLWDRSDAWKTRSDVDRAARFIYLNRTSFNGMWRVNRKGHFNVPFGRYKNPGIPSSDSLQLASDALAKTILREGDFEDALKGVAPGDFVYLDPPYAPVSATASFTSYTDQGFDDTMQKRLAALCQKLSEKGVFWMLSNSDTPYTQKLFGNIPGSSLHIVQAGRAINSDGAGRGKVNEILVVGNLSA